LASQHLACGSIPEMAQTGYQNLCSVTATATIKAAKLTTFAASIAPV